MGDYIVHRARFFNFQPKAVQSMSYDDTIKKLAISRSDNKIEIWCMKDEYLESTIYPTPDRSVESVIWCRSQLLSTGLDGYIVLYDLARLTAKKLVPSIGGAIWCITKNKSESKIVVGTEEGYVVIYEMQMDGILFEKTLNKQDSRILSMCWHKDEEILVTGGINNIRVWDVNSGQVTQRISLGKTDKNKETLVFCLAITSNKDIISGDSRGKVSIWNGEYGTLIKSFQTHSFDVLCLCLNETENHIYCSGIDPSIVRLDYVTTSEANSFKSWVKSNIFYLHTHDVRSIAIADNKLISGGIDTKIVIKNLDDKSMSPSIRKYSSMPQRPVVDACRDFVLLQYERHLELWKLGETNPKIELENKKDGENVQIVRSPRKYLHLRSKKDMQIICSSLGSDPNANKTTSSKRPSTEYLWLAYSDLNVIHIYKLEIVGKNTHEPKVNIDKIKSLPLACANRPAVLMKFHMHSVDKQLRLLYLTYKSCLQSLRLANFETGFVLDSTIQCISQDLLFSDNRIYLIAVKDDLVATVDIDLNLIVWSLKTQQQVCALPVYQHLVTCMSFHPTKDLLLVAYTNRKIIEYDLKNNELTKWSKETNEKFPKQWSRFSAKLLNCFYDKTDENKIVCYDEQYITVIDKNEPMPNVNEKVLTNQLNAKKGAIDEQTEQTRHALHVTNKYRFLIHVGQMSENELLVVERTPLSVLESLPPSLKQKKFGT